MEIFNIDGANDSAELGNSLHKPVYSPELQLNTPSEYTMEQAKPNANKKRNLNFMHAQEINWKLKSKQDFITYFDQHRKCFASRCLTPL